MYDGEDPVTFECNLPDGSVESPFYRAGVNDHSFNIVISSSTTNATTGSDGSSYYSPLNLVVLGRDVILHGMEGEQLVGGSAIGHLVVGPMVKEVKSGMFKNMLIRDLILNGETTIRTGAFENCTTLGSVDASKMITVEANAFKGCTKLTDLNFMQNARLADEAFKENTSISNITLDFEENPTEDYGTKSAFPDDVYLSAKLQNFGDNSMFTVSYANSAPWCYFNRFVSCNALAVGVEEAAKDTANYNNISMPLKVEKGKYFMKRFPFDIDSYYFGADVKIYSLAPENITTRVADFPDTLTILLNPYDIDKNATIPANTPLLICSERKDSVLQAITNLFESKYTTYKDANLTIDPWWYTSRALKSYTQSNKATLESETYIMDDGCLKRINSTDYEIPPYDLIVTKGTVLESTDVFNHIHFVDKTTGKKIVENDARLHTNKDLRGFATFYSDESCFKVASDETEVYAITGVENGNNLTLTRVTDGIVNKGQAVLLKATANADVVLCMVTNGSSCKEVYEKNLLKGVSEDTDVSDLCGGGYSYVYVLSNVYSTPGFYRYSTGKTLPKGKAYLDPTSLTVANNAKGLMLDLSVPTGVDNVAAEEGEAQENVYDLSGRKVSDTTEKGIYIIDNNKKIAR